MAIVVRRYRRVGTSNAALQQRVSATGAVNANFTNVLDVDVDNAVADAVATLDAFMSSIGFPLDVAAVAVDVSAHASRHNGAGADAVPNATVAVAGLMSAADKTKLDGIGAGATSTIFTFGADTIGGAAETRFFPLGMVEINTLVRTTETPTPMGRSGNFKNLRVYHNTAIGDGDPVEYTLIKNGVATTLFVSLDSNLNGPAADTTHTVTCAAGDRFSVQVVKPVSITSGGLNIGGSVEFSN